MIENQKTVLILLRISIASVFMYAAVAATLQPQNWMIYLPQFATNMLPAQLLLHGFSLYQLTLSLWILSGWKTLFAAALSCVTFLAIIAANFASVDILFRDFAIFFASIALAVGSYKKQKR